MCYKTITMVQSAFFPCFIEPFLSVDVIISTRKIQIKLADLRRVEYGGCKKSACSPVARLSKITGNVSTPAQSGLGSKR